MSLMKWSSKYLTLILIVLIVICGVGAFVYSPIQTEPRVVYVDVSPVSSAFSQVSGLTAPWMTYESFSALHLDAYYQVIIDVNIFRPLQKHSSVPINPYQLIGTLEKENETVAYILNTFTRRVHTVRRGVALETFFVENVTRKSVTLRDKDRVKTKLEFSSMFLK